MAEKVEVPTEIIEFQSSLGGLISNLQGNGFFPFSGYGEQISQADTMFLSNRWYMLSNQRQLISQMYVEHGIVQTLVDQPVDDAFRAGVEVQSGELDGDNLDALNTFCERNGVYRALMDACKYARLYGGGAVLIITDQPPSEPFDIKKIGEDTPIEFRAVDMWELYHNQLNIEGEIDPQDGEFLSTDQHFDYYGHRVHPSRVYMIKGKQAPSFVRPRLRGWGMSELERLVRSINQYLKNQTVVFELLDEAKIDVYKMKGFNTSLMTSEGTEQVSSRIQGANMVKNFNNAITMDVNDEYEQKQMAFSGLGEMLVQIRQGIAADLKMPVTKLFGISSAGFNSGEDDIENYNSMIEGEIRSKIKYHVIDLLQISCQKVLGHQPSDLTIQWPSLRILNSKEEEEVKNQQFNRAMSSYQSGAISHKEWAGCINKNNLLPIEVEESEEGLEPLDGQFLVDSSDKVDS